MKQTALVYARSSGGHPHASGQSGQARTLCPDPNRRAIHARAVTQDSVCTRTRMLGGTKSCPSLSAASWRVLPAFTTSIVSVPTVVSPIVCQLHQPPWGTVSSRRTSTYRRVTNGARSPQITPGHAGSLHARLNPLDVATHRVLECARCPSALQPSARVTPHGIIGEHE
jgi:hypothetical protein